MIYKVLCNLYTIWSISCTKTAKKQPYLPHDIYVWRMIRQTLVKNAFCVYESDLKIMPLLSVLFWLLENGFDKYGFEIKKTDSIINYYLFNTVTFLKYVFLDISICLYAAFPWAFFHAVLILLTENTYTDIYNIVYLRLKIARFL